MGIFFTEADGDRYNTDEVVVGAPPFTLSIWFRSTGFRTDYLISANSFAVNNNRLSLHTGVAGGVLSVSARTTAESTGPTVNTWLLNTWSHACGIFTTPTDRRSILNGDWTNSGTQTTSRVPVGIDDITIGGRADTTGISWQDDLAEAAVWDVVLTQSEVQALAAGANPLNIRRASLQLYATLFDISAAGIEDLTGNYTLTADGTPANVASHPPVQPASLRRRLRAGRPNRARIGR